MKTDVEPAKATEATVSKPNVELNTKKRRAERKSIVNADLACFQPIPECFMACCLLLIPITIKYSADSKIA